MIDNNNKKIVQGNGKIEVENIRPQSHIGLGHRGPKRNTSSICHSFLLLLFSSLINLLSLKRSWYTYPPQSRLLR